MYKSPFYVVRDFISPLTCENIVDDCNPHIPNKDKDSNLLKTIIHNDETEEFVFNNMTDLMPSIEKYYNFQYKGINTIHFEWFPMGSMQTFNAENSIISNNKWVRNSINDFTAILFLSDYQNQPPLDNEFEVYGGKLEFLYHKFGFNPTRGTLIVFPSDPHFTNGTSRVYMGNLYQIRIQITSTPHWKYNMSEFPGNYTNWF